MVAEKVAADFDVLALAAVHRVGDLDVGDLAVVVAVACPHRGEAFEACRALIDDLKAQRADLEAPEVRRRRERMGQQCVACGRPCRRQLTLLRSLIAGIGGGRGGLARGPAPVPYVILSPGPTLNTLGKLPGGKPLIQIVGHPHLSGRRPPQPGHGVLPRRPAELASTSSPRCGPGSPRTRRSSRKQELFPPGQTQQQVVQQDTEQMVSSQQTATGRRRCACWASSFTTVDTIVAGQQGPARGRACCTLRDVITAVDGKPVTCTADAAPLIRARAPGAPVTLTIARTRRPPSIRQFHAEDRQRRRARRGRGLGRGELRVPVQRQDQRRQHRRPERRHDVRPGHRRQADPRAT